MLRIIELLTKSASVVSPLVDLKLVIRLPRFLIHITCDEFNECGSVEVEVCIFLSLPPDMIPSPSYSTTLLSFEQSHVNTKDRVYYIVSSEVSPRTSVCEYDAL